MSSLRTQASKSAFPKSFTSIRSRSRWCTATTSAGTWIGLPSEVQVKTAALGKPIHVPAEVVAVHQRDRDLMLVKDFGKADFEAWVRKLDTIDRSWRE